MVAAASGTPAYCDVRGAISGNIKFAVYLPATTWNGRFQMVGNGGKAGSITFSAMLSACRCGYASSSTDTGHDASLPAEQGSKFGNDAVFGKEREIDFGWRAVHQTAVVSKAIVRRFYGSDAAYAYWNGCSTGGRQGLMEAQRFPGGLRRLPRRRGGEPLHRPADERAGVPARPVQEDPAVVAGRRPVPVARQARPARQDHLRRQRRRLQGLRHRRRPEGRPDPRPAHLRLRRRQAPAVVRRGPGRHRRNASPRPRRTRCAPSTRATSRSCPACRWAARRRPATGTRG